MREHRNWALPRGLAVPLLLVAVAATWVVAKVLPSAERAAICETNAAGSSASYTALVSQEPIIAGAGLRPVRSRRKPKGDVIRLEGSIAIEFQQQNFMITRIYVDPYVYKEAGRVRGFGYFISGELRAFMGKIVYPMFDVIAYDVKRREIGRGTIFTKRDSKTRRTHFDGFVLSVQADSIDEIVLLSVVDH